MEYNLLTHEQIVEDGDEGADEIFNFNDTVESYVTTDIARAFIDINRAPDDIRDDGVVKTKTCMNAPIYNAPLPEMLINKVIAKYHTPYHERLTALSRNVAAGIDCHTMFATSPPNSAVPGIPRPHICLGNGDGTCPVNWIEEMANCFRKQFGETNVLINDPFSGGYIIRKHFSEIPWIQIEVSRGQFMTNAEKRRKVFSAIESWVRSIQ